MKRMTHALAMITLFLCALTALGQSSNQVPQDPGSQVPPPQSTPPTFPQSKPGKQQPDPQQPSAQPETQSPAAASNSDQNSARTFTGTIVHTQDNYVLKSGDKEFKLDDQSKVKSFDGKDVKVTGTLDQDKNLIHVQSIEAQPAI
ncbi:MAG TPA: DUF5818 domain-containing protein [Terriglobales bacterium]|jgi:uncharacterized protein YdeI (BOF family)